MDATNPYNPCIGCEYYNKPYWSVVSPCASCPRHYNTGGCVSTTTTAPTVKIERNDELVECCNLNGSGDCGMTPTVRKDGKLKSYVGKRREIAVDW